jgi:hypothetical protein
MKQSGKLFPGRPAERVESRERAESREIETTGRYGTLTLMVEQPHKERGYNPYDTVAHVQDIRRRDVWRHKPKRA